MPTDLLPLEAVALAEAALAQPHPLDALAPAAAEGAAALAALARRAVGRLLRDRWINSTGINPTVGLFTEPELLELAAAFEAALQAGDALARAGLLERMHQLARRELGVVESRRLACSWRGEIPPAGALSRRLTVGRQVSPAALTEALVPQAALDFFRALFAALGRDPLRSGPTLARQAFTLAVSTSVELTRKVQDAIADRIKSGKATGGPKAVADVLDAAGVSVKDPSYPEMVFVTNIKSAYDEAYQHQLSQSVETFPVWKYSNPDDSRSRPTHAARNGKFYPSTVPFTVVRGTTAADVIRCRCVPIAVDRWRWAELKRRGARVADGFAEPVAPVRR